jgi:hypothetical protein
MVEIKTMYMHKETGNIDTREGWELSYDTQEIELRKLTAKQAFDEDVDVTLFEIIQS